ncbi:hypothetical protein [Sinorhizobium terangae]|uniref:hypothetical protein n=1 Tax=Sinorhizobium terangae TaxID=110322 RepID=UPI0024B18CE6|nr:hypothetical protein [Sinorhizobium terangae]WFU51166.1 hypothetical protein QA637_21490 [Sinorhizobium terangae]
MTIHRFRFSFVPFHRLPSTRAEMPATANSSVYCHSDHAGHVAFGHDGEEAVVV